MNTEGRISVLLDGDGRTLHAGGRSTRFVTAHAALLLHLLFQAAAQGKTVSAHAWETAARQTQPDFMLHRNQVMRVLDDIARAFAELDIPAEVAHAPRRRSSGPWHLQQHAPLYLDDSIPAPAADTPPPARADRFFPVNMLSGSPVLPLCRLLGVWTHAYSLFQQGEHRDAAAQFAKLHEQPLAADMRLLANLFQAKALQQVGRFDTAQKLLGSSAACPDAAPELTAWAKQRSAALSYSAAPALRFGELLRSAPIPPLLPQYDIVTLMEWHNLQALLLRRQLERNTAGQPENTVLNRRIFNHTQEALFSALRMENIGRIQDYVLNLAYHLQTVLPKGLSAVSEITACYNLSLLMLDKLDCGGYSVWNRIFFGEFFWNNRAAVLEDPACLEILDNEDSNPQRHSFYANTWRRLDICGDDLQKFLFGLLYLRYARHACLQGQYENITAELWNLLQRRRKLHEDLTESGYGDALKQLAADMQAVRAARLQRRREQRAAVVAARRMAAAEQRRQLRAARQAAKKAERAAAKKAKAAARQALKKQRNKK